MIFDPLKLALLVAFFSAVVFVSQRLFSGAERTAVLLMQLGFLLYSGLAAATEGVPDFLIVSCCIFSAAFLFSYVVGRLMFGRLRIAEEGYWDAGLQDVEARGLWKIFILFYFILLTLKLTYPEFKLSRIFSPPPPDIKAWFLGRFEGDVNPFTKAIDYFLIVLTPFFYLGIYSLRRRLSFILLLFFLSLYLTYVNDGYIGRGRVFFALVVFLVFVWSLRPSLRPVLVSGAALLAPFLAVAFQYYGAARLGLDVNVVSFFSAFEYIYRSEFSFLAETGVPLIESGAHVDLVKYFAWLITLPVPGFLKGGLDVALVNYEISEIVLNRDVGGAGFYVVLAGLLAEAYYIYGQNFYWLHALMLGFIFAIYSSVLARSKHLLGVYAYVFVVFFYSLNRGGVASALPLVVNGFVVFAIFMVFLVARQSKQSRL
ncbi:hypothetical protein [Thauera phenylacetica]